uniref:Uncharacterized protein n=1 Tax=Anopheles arabiensis TaxID=7173 RepID=A0A182HXW1_ANOAR
MNGLPLHKSELTQFWPILMRLPEMPEVPLMTVAIFAGECKPESVEDYLRSFVTELNYFEKYGILINGRQFKIKQRAIIIDDEPRNHDDFKRGVYVGHYSNATPLTDLDGCDTIADIISSEPLHFRDYGISRKCMRGWSERKFSAATKWSPQVRKAISKDLEQLKFPVEFSRKVRSLKYIKFWKGMEYNYFLHNARSVILKGMLTDEEYTHFMHYFCAMTLFNSQEYVEHWPYARELLRQ